MSAVNPHVNKLDDRAKQTREEQAAAELGHTTFAPGTRWALVIGFLLTIISVPVIQHVVEIRRNLAARQAAGGKGRILPQMYDIVDVLPSPSQIASVRSLGDAWALLPPEPKIRQYETALERESVVGQALLPPTQQFMTRWLGLGNEKAFVGVDGWLFYRPDVEYLTGQPFLSPHVLARRAAAGDEFTAPPQPDPIKAILHFQQQLASRGVTLIVMPMPSKAAIHPEKLSPRYAGQKAVLENPSFAEFEAALSIKGVLVFKIGQAMVDRKWASSQPLYLQTDTHWRPATAQWAAGELAAFITAHVQLPPSSDPGLKAEVIEVSAQGDTAAMLKLPDTQDLFGPEKVPLRRITTTRSELWRAAESADVLLLGDSYCNIFSLDAMGWGESAGFAEQLSYELKRPVDVIVRNDSGSHATRELLARELRVGRDRLAGKRVLVWEFAERELAIGDWKLIDLTLGERKPSSFIDLPAGKSATISGQIAWVAAAPLPGTVPYKDHIIAIHLADVKSDDPAVKGTDALVYMWSMRDNQWTPAARYRAGESLRVSAKSWADMQARVGSINTAIPDDSELQLQPIIWGEEAKP